METKKQQQQQQPTNNFKTKWKPHRTLYVAPSQMGKTQLMTKHVLSDLKQGHIEPQRVIIFAHNHLTDKSLEPLIKYCSKKVKDFQSTHCFKNIDCELINELYASQNEIMEKQKRDAPHYLLILDDQLCNPDLFSSKSPVKSVMIQGRHRHISMIINQQKLKMGSTGSALIRENSSTIHIGNLSQTVHDILADYCGGISSDKKASLTLIIQWHQDAVASGSGRGFLSIKPEMLLGEGRFIRSEDGLSYDKGEITSLKAFQLKTTPAQDDQKQKKKKLKQ